jgi:uncharacterized protein (DUF433 family)
MNQLDRVLGLKPGTSKRWIDGYERGRKHYDPVIRTESTGNEIATWGESVETRLLAEYRNAGVSLIHMRPAIVRLREVFATLYPLAHSRPYLDVEGRELVLNMQTDVGLDRPLRLVEVARSGQIVLTEHARAFRDSVQFTKRTGEVELFYPQHGNAEVVVNPLRQFGEPVVRSVPTDVIAEQVRAGDSIESIAEIFELSTRQVEAAVRYELWRAASPPAA